MQEQIDAQRVQFRQKSYEARKLRPRRSTEHAITMSNWRCVASRHASHLAGVSQVTLLGAILPRPMSA